MPTTDAETRILTALADLREKRKTGSKGEIELAEARLDRAITARVRDSRRTMIGASPISPAAPEPADWQRVEP